jgi:hypothetical protein
LTMEKVKFDQLMSVLKFLIVTVGFGYISLSVNTAIQTREIEIKELEQVGKYVDMAVTENIGTRKRFAEYFATVTRSEELKALWRDYERKVNIAYEEEEKKKQAEEAKVKNLEAEISQLKEISKQIDKEIELAKTYAELNNIKQELSVKPLDVQQRGPVQLSGAGWVYLGEYDKSAREWIKVYYNIDRKQNPNDLLGKKLTVTSLAVNVRESMPSIFGAFGSVIDNLKNGTEIIVNRIQEWQNSGYMWAAVSY